MDATGLPVILAVPGTVPVDAAEAKESVEEADTASGEEDEATVAVTDVPAATGVMVHACSSCTSGSPFAPLTGVNVNVHVCNTGPDALEKFEGC